jgi:hypothetical protein
MTDTNFPYEFIQAVGMHFRQQHEKDFMANAEIDYTFRLIREPENQYDENAIKVTYETSDGDILHCAYINKEEASFIAPDMDANPQAKWYGIIAGFQSTPKVNYPLLNIYFEE